MVPRGRAIGFVLFLCAMFPVATMGQSTWRPSRQGIGFGQPNGKQWVQMISSPTLAIDAATQAGKQNDRELRFAIQSGLHINSHTPHSRFLIPTVLTLDKTPGIQVAHVDYPQGVDYHFQFAPKDPLSVYTGEFGLMLRLKARRGRYTLHGQLHYQACDDRACNPPQTLPVQLDVTVK